MIKLIKIAGKLLTRPNYEERVAAAHRYYTHRLHDPLMVVARQSHGRLEVNVARGTHEGQPPLLLTIKRRDLAGTIYGAPLMTVCLDRQGIVSVRSEKVIRVPRLARPIQPENIIAGVRDILTRQRLDQMPLPTQPPQRRPTASRTADFAVLVPKK